MASISYPRPGYAEGSITEVEHEQLTHAQAPDGLIGSPSDPPLVYADGTGIRVVKIRANRRGLVRGSLYDSGDSDITMPSLAENSSGHPRIDLIVLRLDRDSGYTVTETAITGTPGANPVPPAPVQQTGTTGVWDFPVAEVRVEPGATAFPADKVTPRAWYVGDDGQILCTSSTRPPHQIGRLIWESSGRLLLSNGVQWQTVYERTGWTTGSAASGWSVNVFEVRRTDGMVESRIQLKRTGADLGQGADVHIGTIPAGYRPTGLLWVLGFSDGNQLARVRFEADGRLILINHGGIKRNHTLTLTSATWRAA